MPRIDISRDLIHWIKGDSYEESFDVLRKIVSERQLIAGNGHIKGNYYCVCFTEAPIDTFHEVLGRYQPFGIRLSKCFAYSLGGRPVIYQSEPEFDLLPSSLRWRHVRYDPNSSPPVDFTWEREWRIRKDDIYLPPGEASIVVPHESWAKALEDEHMEQEGYRIQMDAVAYGSEWLLQNPEPFVYTYSVVNV